MATMKDLARETGLGLATISKYINGGNVLERNKTAIDAAVDKLGFTVNEFARGLKTRRSRTIGVVIPELSNIFVTTIITVVEDVLRGAGYGVLICDCRTDKAQEADAVKFLLSKQVDGIINMPVGGGSHLADAIGREIPIVLIDRMIPALQGNVNAVLIDNVSAAASATRVLLEAGHREIGIILGPQDVFTSQQRLLGYSQELIGFGIAPNQNHLIFSDYSVQGGHEGMKRLLAAGCSSVFVTNYEMTLGAIIAANEFGVRIPEQLSFIGFDNQHLSRVIQPALTIVAQPLEKIGEAVAELLLSRLSGSENRLPAQIVTLSAKIDIGDSVKTLGLPG